MNPEAQRFSDIINNQETASHFIDRDPIHNIWDQGVLFRATKTTLRDQPSIQMIHEIEIKGRELLSSKNPYEIKMGIHFLRLGIWQNIDLARDWVNNIAPELLTNEHPRVRHSALWNSRSATWMDGSLSAKVLKQAQTALTDTDPAIQRVSLWTHGDAVINDPNLYRDANSSIQAFITANPRESNYLFTQAEYLSSIKETFSGDPEYVAMIRQMNDNSTGYPGVKSRSALLLDEGFNLGDEDIGIIRSRVAKAVDFELDGVLTLGEMSRKSLHAKAEQLVNESTFGERMRKIWMIRDLCWLLPEPDQELFQTLSKILMDNRDGDLIRTGSVLLADNIIQHPDSYSSQCVDTVKEFYDSSDIDGSQIVIGQIARPLVRASGTTRSLLNTNILYLETRAANKSVSHFLGNLKAQS